MPSVDVKLSTTNSEVAAAAAAQSSVRLMRAHIVERRPPIGARASSVLATAGVPAGFLGVTLVRAFLSRVSRPRVRFMSLVDRFFAFRGQVAVTAFAFSLEAIFTC